MGVLENKQVCISCMDMIKNMYNGVVNDTGTMGEKAKPIHFLQTSH